ncbi:MAG: hypothetical protein EKK68_06885 [Candidatus Competibacteraceae bacterium]|nr:MAG: hypothetical protein EKK68_06885 [Candidatus Competibacteraceae bacterium]
MIDFHPNRPIKIRSAGQRVAANSLSVSPLVVGIDASNLRGGGGVTHLAELLLAANPAAHGVDSVVI